MAEWTQGAREALDAWLQSAETSLASAGRCYSDVSAWWWGALTGETRGPWWIWTVIERERT